MLSYLEKYNNLPAALRDGLSTEEVMSNIAEIENEHNISLAAIIMKVMVKDISIVDLSKLFVFEYNLDGRQADELVEKLKSGVFNNAADYLGIASAVKPPAPEEIEAEKWQTDKTSETGVEGSNFFFSTEDEEEVKELTKKVAGFKKEIKKTHEQDEKAIQEKVNRTVYEMNLNFSSEELHSRYWQIIHTYIKGIRDKIDTKQTLMKDVASGGVGLNESLTDRTVTTADRISKELDKEIKSKPKEDIGVVLKKEDSDLAQKKPISTEHDEKAPVFDEKNLLSENKKKKKSDFQKNSRPEIKSELDIKSMPEVGERDIAYDFNSLKDTPQAVSKKDVDAGKAEEKKDDKMTDKVLISKELIEKAEKEKDTSVPVDGLRTINLNIDKDKSLLAKPEGQPKDVGKEAVLDLSKKQGEVKLNPVARETVKIQPPKPKSNKQYSNPPIANWHEPKKGREKTDNGKIKMEDVKAAPKLIGPVEEIGEMDLLNFRRLSSEPQEAADKIKEKINFLEKDSYLKRLNAVSAWRKSPVYALYLGLGQTSINEHKSINDIIKSRQTANEEVLTDREFEAIMGLNKSLRF